MTNNKVKKLSLRRETIRTLSGGQLDAVVGGTVLPTQSSISQSGVSIPTFSIISHLSGIKDQ